METIFSKKSLKFILNAINVGLVEFDDINSLQIISEQKPEFVVKVIDIDLTEFVFDMVNKSSEKDKIDQCETNVYDYIVFSTIIDENNKKTLITIPLFELIITNSFLTETKTKWDLDSEEWSLIIIK